MNFCLDTCFLIDAQRERRRGRGPALEFLKSHASAKFWISNVAWGEFVEGRTPENASALKDIRATLDLLPITEPVAEKYGIITRNLRERGLLIATNDLWIAASALEAKFGLVTRNVDEFSRVEGLRIIPY